MSENLMEITNYPTEYYNGLEKKLIENFIINLKN